MAETQGSSPSAPTSELVTEEAVEYVLVGESEDGEKLELPTNPPDKSLGFSTLTHAFPGAQGLKFKNPVTKASRALLMDSSGTKFLPPADGWKDKTFIVIYPQRSSSDQNTKRKKMMDECEKDSDSEDVSGGPGGQLTAKQKRIEDPSEKNCTDLIVLGIPYTTSSETCKAYFELFGDVVMFDLKKDASGNSKGFGFVRMADYNAQIRVLAKQTHEIDGRRCQVKIPLSKGESAQATVSRIFVGRLPEKFTVEDLRNFFNEEAAKIDPEACVTDVFIPRPFRSFAFVNFSSSLVARTIIKLGDVVLDGCSLAVSAAAPREAPDFSPRSQKSVYGMGSHGGPNFTHKAASQRCDAYSLDRSQAGYYDGYSGSHWDSPRGGGFRNAEKRSYSPAYGASRYGGLSRPGTSQALASGLDALNLNKMNVKPDVVDAAWQAFWSTLNNQVGPNGQNNSKW
ncbi:unnamed protein product [Enterobius vermicularis]|uniref:RRM domain-containing protein n=1 Tax=Enterobius vermicularis TaxID=51028 RepID=A0A158Q9B9_ENTVE|nr:unnamed protein product [Enterobius vermicularis]